MYFAPYGYRGNHHNKIKHCIKGIISNGFVFQPYCLHLTEAFTIAVSTLQADVTVPKLNGYSVYLRVLAVFVPEIFELCELDCVVFVCFHCFFFFNLVAATFFDVSFLSPS